MFELNDRARATGEFLSEVCTAAVVPDSLRRGASRAGEQGLNEELFIIFIATETKQQQLGSLSTCEHDINDLPSTTTTSLSFFNRKVQL